MALYVTISGKGKARVVQLVEQHRIPKTAKKQTKVIETIENYEKLIAEDPDIIEKLREEAKERTKQKKEALKPLTIELVSKELKSTEDVIPSYHFGHHLIHRIWRDLELERFFAQNCQKRNKKELLSAL